MSKVRCNNCMSVFSEGKVVYDSETDMEFCCVCGEGGCITDLPILRLYCISADGGNTYSEQWLYDEDVKTLREDYNYIVIRKGER